MGSIGRGGWEALGNATQLQPGVVSRIVTTKPSLAEARKEDVKTIWEALSPAEGSWGFDIYKTAEGHRGIVRSGLLCVEKSVDDWRRLEQILSMSETDFANEIEEGEGSVYSLEESEDESETESEDESENESEDESEDGSENESEGESEGEYIPEEIEDEDEGEEVDAGAGEEEDEY